MLSDGEIAALVESRDIIIDPWDASRLQPASLDLTLGRQFAEFKRGATVDLRRPLDDAMNHWEDEGDDPFILASGVFLLGTTVERVALPPFLAARVEGKSSLGRAGLQVHVTAGFVDPGFDGQITLEMVNVSGRPLVIWPGMPVCQLSFFRLDSLPIKLYQGAYQGQTGPTPSRFYRNWEGKG